MRKVIAIALLLLFNAPILYAYNTIKYGELTGFEKSILNLGDNTCSSYKQSDIPTIFIPGILASWYQEQGFEKTKIKRWVPDPITHVYDPLFFTFKRNGYIIKDVFYKDNYDLEIKGNPKSGLYLFGYDWKKDNKITASLLTKLYGLILKKYEEYNGCNIGKVNIIAHSMGGLVARAMLENMCADLDKITKNKVKGKINKPKIIACEDKYLSNSPSKNIIINKLITISTPHRGSPKTFPLWEKGDISTTDGFWTGNGLKYKLGILGKVDDSLYKLIHAYDDKIDNGIISIGQLLPDIKNNNKYNSDLLYLKKNNEKIDKYNYPKNSFLEELNKKDNINKIFDKIEGKFISYYSSNTGNSGINNIIGYEISDKKLKYKGKDIYYKYKEKRNKNNYNIGKVYRDSNGKGGDGTVPTKNLKLVPNDSISGKEIKNNKFKSEEIKCNGNFIYENLGLDTNNEICSHSNMIIATSYKVLKDIQGKEDTYNKYNHRLSLLYNLGYANYKDNIMDNNFINKNFISVKNKNVKGKTKYSLNLGSPLKIMTYEILSPINVIIEDSLGRKIGINPDTGMIINEIPGAFTSGDTENSGEPEFFYVPIYDKEKVKISTYGTGNGKYHIVYNSLDVKTNITNGGIIAGNSKKHFGENYTIQQENNNFSVKNTTNNLLLDLEVVKNIKTNNSIYNLPYYIRGKSDRVKYIQYQLLSDTGTLIKEDILEIKGNLKLELTNVSKYKLKLTILDKNFDKINSINSYKEILIERVNNITSGNFILEKRLGENSIISFEDRYYNKIQDITKKIKKMSFIKRNKLKIYIQDNKENLINKIKNNSIKDLYSFFLDKIIEIIIDNN